MKVLLIGGTGIISTGVAKLALSRGMEVYVLNRGLRPGQLQPGCKEIIVDYRGEEQPIIDALGDLEFDVVVDFLIQGVEAMERAIRIFSGRCKQYFLISSGTVYKKPLENFIITEDAPLGNLHSKYARNKIASENTLRAAIEKGFPGVIIRPSLTYADFNMLVAINSRKHPYSIINRMRKGKPIVVHGDGTSLWTITHTDDFAKGIVGLFGNEKAIGEAFHITSDEVLDWDRIYTQLAHAAGVEAKLIHIASDFIGEFYPPYLESLEGDHSCTAVFDNSKIKSFVPDFKCTIPFAEGAKRSVEWYDADPNARETVEDEWDEMIDAMIAKYQGLSK
jgi:nucleoside-diphosphate-sugar epimerase